MKNIAVIGGGAAGMMAAIRALELGNAVTIYERNEKLGKKLFITGKGRCNVTNACEPEQFFAHVNGKEKFLYSAYYTFDNNALQKMIEEAGCPLKVERGNRVFPVSDHSSDIIKALKKRLEDLDCRILYRTGVKRLLYEQLEECREEQDAEDKWSKRKNKGKNKPTGYLQKIVGIETDDGKKAFYDAVILATGGVSYPSTGSTGDGHRFAEAAGLSVTKLIPSLVPLETKESWAHELQGLSLKNVQVTLFVDDKKVYEEQGEMLFTHFGVSGPLILTASSELAARGEWKECKLVLDLKPALTEEQFDKRLLREFEEGQKKFLKNILPGIYPARLAETIMTLAEADPYKPVHSITREERKRLLDLTKHLSLTVTGTRDFKEAIITCGGIGLKEINPSTMETKKIKGLYIAGELLDLDAHTGGYNLQIAWSSGYLAGESAGSAE